MKKELPIQMETEKVDIKFNPYAVELRNLWK